MTKLNPPETAPKDKLILINIGISRLFVGLYNHAERKWHYNGTDNYWFEGERTEKVLGWLPIPEIERQK